MKTAAAAAAAVAAAVQTRTQTQTQTQTPAAAAIMQLLAGDGDGHGGSGCGSDPDGGAPAPADDGASTLLRARAFAAPLLAGQLLPSNEPVLDHADGAATILQAIGAAPSLRAAVYLVHAGDHLQRPDDTIAKAFGASHATLAAATRKLVLVQRAAQQGAGRVVAEQRALQLERVRKMLLAFSHDLRVVLLRLASRLQTLRWYAASRQPCPPALAEESQQVFAPLANRLGIWQIKWELEDLAFRFLRPDDYKAVARLLDEKRAAREAGIDSARAALAASLAEAGLRAEVQGRPKHLYSIWKKMQAKQLGFDRVFDLRALRVIVDDTAACYAALARVHDCFEPVDGEFDDYIARPKGNGYQSLHTVVRGADGRPVEVQIRTRRMHEHAEHGVAAHWLYKEAGSKSHGASPRAAGDHESRIAEARKAVLRELLAWESDVTRQQSPDASAAASGTGDRIYVFTPQATIIDLPPGGTPIDFAYSLHTELGHRCRGARVDGALVPLNTPLKSGQTVDIVSAREGGPSMDWLNPELGFIRSPRTRAKVRAWFNAQAQGLTIARGREQVEKLLQREGRTALRLETLAEQLGFKTADALFEAVGKDEFSRSSIETLLHKEDAPAAAEPQVHLSRPRSEPAHGGKSGVLVVGIESLLATLSRCCRPAPPDGIGGYVTRGKGVAVHRRDCSNFRQMAQASPGRVIDVAWRVAADGVYPLDVIIEASDRQGLLRDISEVFAKEKINVIGVNTRTVTAGDGGTAWMTFTVETGSAARLGQVLAQVDRVDGVRQARRR